MAWLEQLSQGHRTALLPSDSHHACAANDTSLRTDAALPDTLAEYERLQPGIPQRIFELAERQTIYRQAPDERGQLADIAAQNAEIELARRHLRGSRINARLGYCSAGR
ncbi:MULTISPECIES: DUF2335 domain-containing protein [Cupriavidus]|uniref:DUF2335 domain-containing protein n=1 Tax=Cupriavidus TaxID=106589 RepID=UPI000FFBAB89|nr:DUF2335 domain-containing protein [Cupriavidus metallidurans]